MLHKFVGFREILYYHQRSRFLIFLSAVTMLHLLFFNRFIIKLTQVFILFYSIFKLFLLLNGIFTFKKGETVSLDTPTLNLPRYSIIVALYQEIAVAPQIIESLANIDYPQEKLDIYIGIEADDLELVEYFQKNQTPPNINVITIPSFKMKTKPKALNYCIPYCKGEFVAVYDAEDIIPADQIKKSVTFFQQDTKCTYGAIQAILNFYNRNQNCLTLLFQLEYFSWFFFNVKSLCDHFHYTPLGGSSNHFRKSALIEVGYWDARNVTEDLDISIKLTKRGYKIGFLNSITAEECPYEIKSWLKQRSRWIKGYILTYLSYFTEFINITKKRNLIFHLTVGASWFNFFITSIMMIQLKWNFEISFYIYIITIVILYCFITFHQTDFSLYKLLFVVIFLPIYFLLHIAALYMAIYELIYKPFYWQKTKHHQKDPHLN